MRCSSMWCSNQTTQQQPVPWVLLVLLPPGLLLLLLPASSHSCWDDILPTTLYQAQ